MNTSARRPTLECLTTLTSLITVGSLAGCTGPSAIGTTPSRSERIPVPFTHRVATDECARVDPSFDQVVVAGRWGDRDVLVLIDTGARSAAIASALAKELTARPGETVSYAGASGQVRTSPVYDVAGLRLGGTTLGTFRAGEMTLADPGYDMRIGLKNLEPYVVDFLLEEEWFCLRDRIPADVPPERLAPMPVIEKNGELDEISLDTTIAGRRVPSMILDTGAGVSTINESLLATIPNRRLGSKVESIDGSGVRKVESYVQVSELCTFGVCEARQILMPGDDLSTLVGHRQLGIVGVPFMRRHRFVLDIPHRRMAIDP